MRDDFVVTAIDQDEFTDTDISVFDTGEQSLIATAITSASAQRDFSAVTASSNTQMTFNPDLVANGQVSALAINTVIASVEGDMGPLFAGVLSTRPGDTPSYSKASCLAKFTLRNNQMNPPSTQIKLKIKQSSSYSADPAFDWKPEHWFAIYKNESPTPMLTSSASGEVTLIDPTANLNDYYIIEGFVNAKGGVRFGADDIGFGNIIHLLGSLEVTGEAEVSVVP